MAAMMRGLVLAAAGLYGSVALGSALYAFALRRRSRAPAGARRLCAGVATCGRTGPRAPAFDPNVGRHCAGCERMPV